MLSFLVGIGTAVPDGWGVLPKPDVHLYMLPKLSIRVSIATNSSPNLGSPL
ncbi:MAG TPA: hypothetical protein VFQ13_09415 [Anaerolineales bacterium]|nr:hypothetical protein [Anaerolineales bacterium]